MYNTNYFFTRSLQTSPGNPRSAQVSLGYPRSAQVTPGHPKVSPGHPRLAQVTPRSAQVSPGQPRSPLVQPRLTKGCPSSTPAIPRSSGNQTKISLRVLLATSKKGLVLRHPWGTWDPREPQASRVHPGLIWVGLGPGPFLLMQLYCPRARMAHQPSGRLAASV